MATLKVPGQTKAILLDTLHEAVEKYKQAENMLHPSLNVYKDIHDAKMALKEIISDIEDGVHDKVIA